MIHAHWPICPLAGVPLTGVLLAGVLPPVVLLPLVGRMVLVASGLLEEKGKTTGIGDAGGGGGVATLWRFACALVPLVPFLFC